jgi:hypothetical protein
MKIPLPDPSDPAASPKSPPAATPPTPEPTGLSEGTAAMIQPQPLWKATTILFTPANTALADKADSKPPGEVAATAAPPVPSQLLEPEPAQSGNEQTPGSVPKEPTPERHWRATPLDRRRTIVVDEPLDV